MLQRKVPVESIPKPTLRWFHNRIHGIDRIDCIGRIYRPH